MGFDLRGRYEVTESGCWQWQGTLSAEGYGRSHGKFGDKVETWAHRCAYAAAHGPIPAGMTVDHLCFNPGCVNPEHLRLLTNSENAANQLAAYWTHCKRGHEFTPENTVVMTNGNGRRQCRTCKTEHRRRLHERAKAARLGQHCP